MDVPEATRKWMQEQQRKKETLPRLTCPECGRVGSPGSTVCEFDGEDLIAPVPANTGTLRLKARKTVQPLVMYCPECQRRYPARYMQCQFDGAFLKLINKSNT